MTNDIAPSHTKEVIKILRDFKRPEKWQDSPWLSSCLVISYMKSKKTQNPSQAVRDVFTDTLMLLAKENADYEKILRGRFWDEVSVRKMVNDGRPQYWGERNFHIHQEKAITHFTSLLLEREKICQESMRKKQKVFNILAVGLSSIFLLALIWALIIVLRPLSDSHGSISPYFNKKSSDATTNNVFTAFPTPTPEIFTVPATKNSGATYQAQETGWYTFEYVESAYTGEAANAHEAGWATLILIFDGEQPKWKRNSLDYDHARSVFGYGGEKSRQDAINQTIGQKVKLELNTGDQVTFVAADGKLDYADNSGEIIFKVFFTPSTVNDQINFQDNFDNGLDKFKNKLGLWTILSEANGNRVLDINSMDTSIEYPTIEFGESSWKDFIFESRINIIDYSLSNQAPLASIRFRGNYKVAITPYWKSFSLVFDRPWKVIDDRTIEILKNRWYFIRIEVKGSDVNVFLENKLVMSDTIPRESSGLFGFSTWPRAHVQFDDVVIKPMDK